MDFSFAEYFSVKIFFILFREILECSIVVSVLLAFLEKNFETLKTEQAADATGGTENIDENSGLRTLNVNSDVDTDFEDESNSALYNKFRWQVWLGTFSGFILCSIVGGLFIASFYLLEIDLWSKSEHYWESFFSILACIVITIMGVGMLQLHKLEKKWHLKLTSLLKTESAISNCDYQQISASNDSFFQMVSKKLTNWKISLRKYSARNSMFILPFITTLRESLESIVFVGGIGVSEPPITVLCSSILGIAVGVTVGLLIYRSGTKSVSAQKFLMYSTCFLYLISAGLMAKGVWQFELQQFIDKCDGLDVSEVGSGPGSYDVDNLVWHVNCCNGEADGPWMIVTAIFGWTNSATYGSVSAYLLYWIVVIFGFSFLRYEGKHGYLPLIPYRWQLRRIKKNYKLLTLLNKSSGSTVS